MIIIWMGILNALRGFSFGDNPKDPPPTKGQKAFNLLTSKGMFSIVSGISIAHYLGYYHELAAISAVGVFLFCMKGWGTALNMTWKDPATRPYEPESKLLDKLAFKITGITLKPFRYNGQFTGKQAFKSDSDAIKYSLVWTSLRGLYITPLFLGLAYLASDPVVIFCSAFGLLMGPIYWLNGPLYQKMKHKERKYIGPTRIVEFIVGCCVIGLPVWFMG